MRATRVEGQMLGGGSRFGRRRVPAAGIGVLVLLSALGAGSARAATFVVNNTGDADDSSPGNGVCLTAGGVCTLRAAITEANALAGADTITFTILPAGAKTIVIGSALPQIASVVTIDGTTQTGAVGGIEISAAACGANAALDLAAGSSTSTIRGLVINRCPSRAIRIVGSNNNFVVGNFLGTDPTGAAARANGRGILVQSSGNTVGGTAAADRNVISGNTTDGVQLDGAAATGNTVLGNLIGLDVTGTADLGNRDGVHLSGGATGNTVGGTLAGARNVISGNDGVGVYLGDPSQGNLVQGNYVGTNAAGTAAVGNNEGIRNDTETGANTIGGTAAGAGNLVSGNLTSGILIGGSGGGGALVQGNLIGTDKTGLVALPNTNDGIYLVVGGGGSYTIGGTVAGARNVIAGNNSAGIDIGTTAAGTTVQGNYIGIGIDGATAVQNRFHGIIVEASGALIGGTAAGAGNVISANRFSGIYLNGGTGITVQGNAIGTDATRTLARGNTVRGIWVTVGTANALIGGTTAGAGNLIADNAAAGIEATGTGSGNSFLGNSLYSNGGLGIDLNADGVTANDPLDADTGPNGLLNFPQIQAASPSAGTVTVNFKLDVPAGSYRVEFFKNPSGADPSGYGEAQAYASSRTLTHPGGGAISFNHSFAGVAGDVITATATACTDGAACTAFGSTSELSNAFTAAPASAAISGTVFEDVNYGGGAGRDRASAAGVVRSGARVELYDTTGAFVSFTTTDAAGNYSFSGLGTANYTVRVVNSTVTSSRTGYVATLRSVQTYRTDASTGSAVAAPNYVGGQNPAVADAGNGGAGTVMDTATGVFTAGIAGTAQSITNVTLGPSNVTAVDFGFNFDTVVNTNDSGQGSLRMLLTNANTLTGDAALVQVGLVAGKENAVFMISNGTAAPGLRAAYNYFAGGVATIAPLSSLPAIASPLVLDAQKQPGWAGAPVVELNGASAAGDGLALTAGTSAVRGLVINRFSGYGISVPAPGGNTLAGNYVGTNAAGAAALANGSDGIHIQASSNNTVGGTTAAARNVVSGNSQSGIVVTGAGATGNLVQGNYVGTDAAGTAGVGNGVHGVYVAGAAANNTVGGTTPAERNVISGNVQQGVRIDFLGTTGNVVSGNFIGTDYLGTGAIPNDLGGVSITLNAASNTIGGAAAGAGNLIAYNLGQDGISTGAGAGTGNAFLGNAIFSNAGLGIDLRNDGLTWNDLNDADTGPNNLQNFPVLTAAMTNGAGSANFAGSLSAPALVATYRIEFFASAAADPTGFGEGQRYLGFTNVTTNASGYAIIGVTLATSLAAGELVTATATPTVAPFDTSEFSAAIVAYGSLIVTTTSDSTTGSDTSSVSALIATPGADGRISLREAILATNATPGADTIRFGIPLTDAGHLYYFDNSAPGLGATTSTPLADVATASSPAIANFDPDYPAGLTRSWYRIQPGSALPTITGAVTIDATTQPGSLAGGPVVELYGATAGAGVSGLAITAGPSTVKGLVVDRFASNGLNLQGPGGVSVAGNYIGTDVSGTMGAANGTRGVDVAGANGTVIGGTTAADRNVISGNGSEGIHVNATSQNALIQGNSIGTDVTGTVAIGNTFDGVWIESNGGPSTIGGTVAGSGNLISGNGEDGISINGTANGMVVQGNRIGTDVTGLLNRGNATTGIHISGGNAHVVGGTSASARNVIGGNGGNGMLLAGGATSATIQGNYIGVGADGATKIANSPNGIDVGGTGTVVGGTVAGAGNVISGNTQAGIYVNGGSGVVVQGNAIGTDATRTVAVGNADGIWLGGGTTNLLVGGTTAGAANVIAHNTFTGIATGAGAGSGNSFLENSLYANGGLGIDLLDNGVTANDALDADTGPNGLLNFPQVMSASPSAGTVTAWFKLDVPAGSYRIEFFKNPSGADASGYGEGQVFAGSANVAHPGGGVRTFNASFPGNAGDVIAATTTACTDGAVCATFGSTSEFSNDVTAFTTAVELMSFTATGADRAVDLRWQTGSELDNLGFHLYRGLTESGPWTRLNASLIPGLGSSPVGASYSWHDGGLENGTRYYYRLEDVDAASVSTSHGPVWAVPSPPGEDGGDDGSGDGTERGASCPSWILAAAPDAVSPTCTRHGDPEATSLQVLSRDGSAATLELHTGGFWALHEKAETPDAVAPAGAPAGRVRVFVRGLEFPADPAAPALPLRRALVEAVVGRKVELASAEALDLRTFPGLRPSAVGVPEMAVRQDGTVRPGRRAVGSAPAPSRGYVPREVVRLSGTVFQGEKKSAVVEITPVRLAGSGLVLAGTVRVRLAFTGVAEGERGTGGRGRSLPRWRDSSGDVLARLHTSRRGLHAASFEQLFPQRGRGVSTAMLRLQRQGEAVAFHVEPAGVMFSPGSVLYFFADRTAASTDYSPEVAYELVRAPGVQMGLVSGTPQGGPAGSASTASASFETNRIYQPGLLEAPDVWLWDAIASGVTSTKAFTLSGVDMSSGQAGRLVVHLQGASESGLVADHHVRVFLNGAEVGETRFAGKRPERVELEVPVSALEEGANELALTNAGDTGVASLVFLDRFEVSCPQVSAARGGVFEGVWGEGTPIEVGGLSGATVVLSIASEIEDASEALSSAEGSQTADSLGAVPVGAARTDGAVRWLTGFQATPGAVRFQAESGRRYVVVSAEGLLSPRIEEVAPSTLREAGSQADYLVIAPRAFLDAAQPLLERRRDEGLTSRAVAFEEIAAEFGHGQESAEAIREFLSYAYHSWRRPSPRFVLLLGDSTVDPQRFVANSGPSPLPALWTKTSYMWTVSDPALAAVNGDDLVPDLAIGRLPAATVEEAQRLVGKVLAWEESGQGLGGDAVLVADDPDRGGDFEEDVEDIRASFLSGRPTTVLKVSKLGSATRAAIVGAFDEGASLMSYVGHGGTAVWASENVLNTWDVGLLGAQGRQPLLLTMDCLNGYFVATGLDALPEAFLKAEGRGAVGAFSPSGLSLDGPAHQYHRAVMAELVSGKHERLGDAILAAQRTYAETGQMPELLTVYQLLGDPALRIR